MENNYEWWIAWVCSRLNKGHTKGLIKYAENNDRCIHPDASHVHVEYDSIVIFLCHSLCWSLYYMSFYRIQVLPNRPFVKQRRWRIRMLHLLWLSSRWLSAEVFDVAYTQIGSGIMKSDEIHLYLLSAIISTKVKVKSTFLQTSCLNVNPSPSNSIMFSGSWILSRYIFASSIMFVRTIVVFFWCNYVKS